MPKEASANRLAELPQAPGHLERALKLVHPIVEAELKVVPVRKPVKKEDPRHPWGLITTTATDNRPTKHTIIGTDEQGVMTIEAVTLGEALPTDESLQ